MNQKAIITGFGGQLSFYMAKYLLENTDLDIIAAAHNPLNLPPEFTTLTKNPRVKVTQLNLKNDFQIKCLIEKEKPDYFINLGGLSATSDSWLNPSEVFEVNTQSLIHILEAVRFNTPNCRVFSAGSVEEFNLSNIYSVSKKAAGDLCKIYREKYNIYVTHCQLGNSESPLRPESYITRKITKGVIRISRAIKNRESFYPIRCGNINNKVSWLHCQDTVDGIWKSLNQNLFTSLPPQDYVICSNELSTVKTFIELTFKELNIQGYWTGEGKDEKYIIENNVNDICELKSRVLIAVDLKFYRSNNGDINYNSEKIREELGFAPKFQLKDIIKEMIAADLKS